MMRPLVFAAEASVLTRTPMAPAPPQDISRLAANLSQRRLDLALS